jgi:hypothetical protein
MVYDQMAGDDGGKAKEMHHGETQNNCAGSFPKTKDHSRSICSCDAGCLVVGGWWQKEGMVKGIVGEAKSEGEGGRQRERRGDGGKAKGVEAKGRQREWRRREGRGSGDREQEGEGSCLLNGEVERWRDGETEVERPREEGGRQKGVRARAGR